MSFQGISTGTIPNDGTGDSLSLAGRKINSNFNDIYNAFGDGTTLFQGNPGIVVGLVTATGLVVNGDVSIAGTLTYEDVNNIDSVGFITARSGVRVDSGGIIVTSGVSTFNDNAKFNDNARLYFGTGNDLGIYHNGTDSYIDDQGDGDLYIRGGPNIRFMKADGIETYAVMSENNSVELYYDNSKKFETTSTGVRVTGGIQKTGGTSSEFLKADGSVDSNTYLINLTDDTTPQLGGDLDLNNRDINGTGNIDVTGALKVSGVSTITTLNVTGVSTFQSNLDINASIDVDGNTFLDDTEIDGNLNVTGTGIVTATTFDGSFSGTATNATNIAVTDESADTTCFPVFVTAATGNQPPKTGSNLSFNSSDGTLTAVTFDGDLVGDVTGNADTATTAGSATNATNTTNIAVADESSDTTCFPVFTTAATGNQPAKTDSSALTYNASTGTLAATNFSGNGSSLSSLNASNISSGTISDDRLPATISSDITGSSASCTGNSNTASTATNANNINVADNSSDTTCFPVFTLSATGNQAPKTDADRLTYNAATGSFYSTINRCNEIYINENDTGGGTKFSLHHGGNARFYSEDDSLSNYFTTIATGELKLDNGSSSADLQVTGNIEAASYEGNYDVATWFSNPTSANLKSVLTDWTGSGGVVFATSPTLTSPELNNATASSVLCEGTGGISPAGGTGGVGTFNAGLNNFGVQASTNGSTYAGVTAHAWAKFRGWGTGSASSVSIYDSFNVQNVERTATGEFTIRFVRAISGAGDAYTVVGSAWGNNSNGNAVRTFQPKQTTMSSVGFQCVINGSSTLTVECFTVYFIVMGPVFP